MNSAMNPAPDSAPLLLARVLRRRQALGQKFARLSPDDRAGLSRFLRKATQTPSPVRLAETTPASAPTPPPAPTPVPATTPAAAGSPAAHLILAGADKQAQVDHLRRIALACTKCQPLAASRTQVVFGVGNINARLMFVGEAPGADEDAQGEPFVGRAGQLLTKMINAMGLSRADVYIGNVLKCRPDMPPGSQGNRPPTQSEMTDCLPYLQAQIAIIRPEVIVTLGATALQGLLGLGGINKHRGVWQRHGEIPVMPTYHPSFLLRPAATNAVKRLVWEDLLAVMERLGMPVSPKQRTFFLSPRGPGA